MTTREERNLQLLKTKRRKKLLVSCALIFVLLLAAIGVFEQLTKTHFSPIKLVSKSHNCTIDGCEYSLLIKNTSYLTNEGYANLNAFVRVELGHTERFDLIAKERLVFSLKSGEEKRFEGRLKTSIIASRFTASAGLIKDSN